MLDHPPRSPRMPRSERVWRPVLAAGASEPVAAAWFEELLTIAAECIGVLLLAALGAVIYLFNYLVFRSRAPRRDDVQDSRKKGNWNNA